MGYTLLSALEIIEQKVNDQLSMIEFEDDSGLCFNYSVYGRPERHFIRLENPWDNPEMINWDKSVYDKKSEQEIYEEQMLEAANEVDMHRWDDNIQDQLERHLEGNCEDR